MTLEVSAANAPAQALYLSEGFAVVGRRPKFYNDGSDAVLMDADLS
jgi:ribosomal protein S18 acetylase RimI-like enzyme